MGEELPLQTRTTAFSSRIEKEPGGGRAALPAGLGVSSSRLPCRGWAGESWFSAGSHLTGSEGTWIGLVIRLDVDLALGQHLRKFPLQLLILLVVGNSIDRSTESSGKPGSKQGKEQSEELSNTELGLWEPPGRRRGHTQVRRSRERLEELDSLGVSITSCTQGWD